MPESDIAPVLLQIARHGALATLLDGHPYASLVACAAGPGGAPILLLSELAEHTRNLRADPRASLMVAAEGAADPLAEARATFVGRCAATDDAADHEAYLAAHPEARRYLEMKDFHFWRLAVEAVRTVGGFGVMSWKR
jgi:heme oxygenase (biliverdin-IX-beta and delta-forming)